MIFSITPPKGWVSHPYYGNKQTYIIKINQLGWVSPTLGFMQRVTQANAHLAHLQAPTHKLILQLVKEPDFCRRTIKN